MHHCIGCYGHLGMYDLGCLDVDHLHTFHKLYLGNVDPIQMVYYWPYHVQFWSNFLPWIWRNFRNCVAFSLWKDQIVLNLWKGGLVDFLSRHRSEYCQHHQGKTLNFSDIESDTPMTHPWLLYGLASRCCTSTWSHNFWLPWKFIWNNNALIQTWFFCLEFLAMSLLIYRLLDIISADKNCLFQPPHIGFPL